MALYFKCRNLLFEKYILGIRITLLQTTQLLSAKPHYQDIFIKVLRFSKNKFFGLESHCNKLLNYSVPNRTTKRSSLKYSASISLTIS